MKYDTVKRVKWIDHLKEVFLAGGKCLQLPRSACVSEGDSIALLGNNAWVVCKNGNARISPTYVARELLVAGGMCLEFIIKEITDPEEFFAYQALTQFHYRGHTLCGRTARLIVRNFHPIYPKVVGYVEITTPFYMNKPRSLILDAPFKLNGISWEAWDTSTLRRYIHLVVRIARCVIYPEFRGLGLGKVLVKHAAEFALHRWQVAHLKPYFLEISADMLKFVPFAQKAGMIYIGETEGNLKRVAKDMSYLLRNQERVRDKKIVKEEACGIVDQQVSRMNRSALLMKREQWDLDELVNRLEQLSVTAVLRDFNLFHDIVSLPKPTYLKGLTPEAERFIHQRVAEVAPQNGKVSPPIQLQPLYDPIKIEDLSLIYQSRVRRTWQTHAIQQAFGISPDEISHTIVHDLSLTINPGDIILVTGPSGSGKTSLLRLFANTLTHEMSGSIKYPDNYHAGTFTPIRSQKALVEIVGGRDVQAALYLMGLVGLSDAFIYLKRFEELSNGQQYRVMLAKLIAGGCNVWLADEFCANLDPITGNVVASSLQRIARKLGAVLIVASSQPEMFAAALRPNQVVQLTTAWEHRIVKGGDFLRTLPNQRSDFPAPSLAISAEYLSSIRLGKKCTTIRKGRKSINKGLLLLTTKADLEPVNVTDVRIARLSVLTEKDAKKDGFNSLADLRQALHKYYPNLRPNSWITVATFELLSKIK